MRPASISRFVWAGIAVAAIAGCGTDESPEKPQNTAPTACFHLIPATVPTETSFTVDARCSSDAQDATRLLQVRWDWENDGTWDTNFSTTQTSAHRYATPGIKTIRLEVKDTGGLRDTETRELEVTAVGEFVLVPPGAFTMGSPIDEPCRSPDEVPHRVTLTQAFYVSSTEVTQAQWRAVMPWNESYTYGANLPVERVTWFDALRYCNERSLREGLEPAYTITDPVYEGNHVVAATVAWNRSARGYRLLTEAEWEYACRAGSTTAFCRGGISECGGGSDPNLDLLGWYTVNSGRQTHLVETKEPNAWGIHDMHGNVWSWCWDLYGGYGESETDPAGADSGSVRVIRGGSWNARASACRSAMRGLISPETALYDIGLRVARTAP
jgi:formylglycine-generating enzyme required for sulfatase activity